MPRRLPPSTGVSHRLYECRQPLARLRSDGGGPWHRFHVVHAGDGAGEGIGALNLYSRTSAAFDDDATARVEVFARQAAIVLSNAQVYWDARQLSENLQQAIRTRSTIDQAVGILLASGGRSPEEAFQLLVRASQRENRKLRDIAEEIVTRTTSRRGPDGKGILHEGESSLVDD